VMYEVLDMLGPARTAAASGRPLCAKASDRDPFASPDASRRVPPPVASLCDVAQGQ
jgi:hypothetical protein